MTNLFWRVQRAGFPRPTFQGLNRRVQVGREGAANTFPASLREVDLRSGRTVVQRV